VQLPQAVVDQVEVELERAYFVVRAFAEPELYALDFAHFRARGSTLRITLRAPAGDLLTRLALPMFCPVPTNFPADAAVCVRSDSTGDHPERCRRHTHTHTHTHTHFRPLLEPNRELSYYEEEAPRSGLAVARASQLARTPGGTHDRLDRAPQATGPRRGLERTRARPAHAAATTTGVKISADP
jgi:hypothetical protein